MCLLVLLAAHAGRPAAAAAQWAPAAAQLRAQQRAVVQVVAGAHGLALASARQLALPGAGVLQVPAAVHIVWSCCFVAPPAVPACRGQHCRLLQQRGRAVARRLRVALNVCWAPAPAQHAASLAAVLRSAAHLRSAVSQLQLGVQLLLCRRRQSWTAGVHALPNWPGHL